MKNTWNRLPDHHKVWMTLGTAFGTVILSIACIIGYFVAANARQGVQTQLAVQRSADAVTVAVGSLVPTASADLMKIDRDVLSEVDLKASAILTGLLGDSGLVQRTDRRVGQILALAGSLPDLVDARIGKVQDVASSKLDAIGGSVLSILNDPAKGLIPPVLSIIRIVNQVAIDHLVEKGNHASWPADISGLLRSLELAMGSIEKSAKVISAEVPKITADVDMVADSGVIIAQAAATEAKALTAPPTFWGAVRSWTFTLAKIWSLL